MESNVHGYTNLQDKADKELVAILSFFRKIDNDSLTDYQADAINQAVKHAVYYGMLLEALHHKAFSIV